MTIDEAAEILPPAELARLRQAGHTFRAIAKVHGIARTTLRRYAKLALPPYIYRPRRPIKITLDHCTRCTFLPEPRNPLLEDGICLWCHVELAGYDLLTYHESGMAVLVLEKLAAHGYTTPFTPHPATATELYYARQLIQSPLWENRWSLKATATYRYGFKSAVCQYLWQRRYTGHHNRKTRHIIDIAEQLAKQTAA